MNKKDYYKSLGVSETASEAEIKQAFRKLAKEYHPDRHPNDKQAEEKFKEINEAYEVLSDPQKKKQYDEFRKYGGADFGGFQQQGQPGGYDFGDINDLFSRGRRSSGGKANDFTWEFGGLGDIFSTIFDQGERFRQRQYGSNQGEDISSELTIPFEVAALGGTLPIVVPHEDVCQHCHGEGAEPGSQVEQCPHCHGRGTISISQGSFAFNQPCPYCAGRGEIIKQPCRVCRGQGVVSVEKKINVRIPVAIDNHEEIRLRGLGKPGVAGGKAGDLYVVVHLEPHHFFKREGLDVYCEVPLAKDLAAQGAKIKVKTINGNKALVTIPPGTRSGAVFRLRGAGLKKNSEVGNQYVQIKLKR